MAHALLLQLEITAMVQVKKKPHGAVNHDSSSNGGVIGGEYL
jgi:hypothetical protein